MSHKNQLAAIRVFICVCLGSRLVVGAEPEPRAAWQGHTMAVHVFAFSPDGKWLASRSADETARLWEIATGKSTVVGDKAAPWHMYFSSDSQKLILASRTDPSFQVVDIASGQWTRVGRQLDAKGKIVGKEEDYPVAFSPDGKFQLLAAVTGPAMLQSLSKPFDPSTGGKRLLLTTPIPRPAGRFIGYLFSPDSKTLAIKDQDRNTILWSTTTGRSTSLPNSQGYWFRFNTRGNVLLTHTGSILPALGREAVANPGVKQFSSTGVPGAALAITIEDPSDGFNLSADGKVIVGWDDLDVKLWSGASGKPTAVLEKPAKDIFYLNMSPDGKIVLGPCQNELVVVWNVTTRKIVATLEKRSPATAISADGKTMAIATAEGTVQLYDLPMKPAGK